MTGPFPPGLAGQLAELHRRVKQLESMRVSGQGVSSYGGTVSVRATQMGFAGETTALWSASVGYAFKRKEKAGVSIDNPAVQFHGDNAVSVDGNTTYPVGTKGWFEADPLAGGWIFFATPVAGSGAPNVDVNDDPVNGDPGFGIIVGTVPVPEVTPTTPVVQLQLAEDYDGAGNPGIEQSVYVAGTQFDPVYQTVYTETSVATTYNINSQTGGYTVTESGGEIIWQYTTGVTLDFTNVTELDLTGVTVTGFTGGGGRTSGTLAATGNNQGNAAAITDDTTSVTGADGTKGVILPDEAGAMFIVRNADVTNDLKVYPPSGAAINQVGTNTAVDVTHESTWLFCRVDSTVWAGVAVFLWT